MSASPHGPAISMLRSWIAWSLFSVLTLSIAVGMLETRRRAVTNYGSRQAQTEWDAWRTHVASQSGQDSPVQRRIPASDAPPALVLMTDYFGPCLGFILVLTSALFWTAAFMFAGVLRRD
jgi:hypothetical protein